ncbi:hypothetical protein ENBRE01_1770 [Enteropsectra breve]|nr:hypothetical protein ENBRE01_1770 [Enteropsectra breve]
MWRLFLAVKLIYSALISDNIQHPYKEHLKIDLCVFKSRETADLIKSHAISGTIPAAPVELDMTIDRETFDLLDLNTTSLLSSHEKYAIYEHSSTSFSLKSMLASIIEEETKAIDSSFSITQEVFNLKLGINLHVKWPNLNIILDKMKDKALVFLYDTELDLSAVAKIFEMRKKLCGNIDFSVDDHSILNLLRQYHKMKFKPNMITDIYYDQEGTKKHVRIDSEKLFYINFIRVLIEKGCLEKYRKHPSSNLSADFCEYFLALLRSYPSSVFSQEMLELDETLRGDSFLPAAIDMLFFDDKIRLDLRNIPVFSLRVQQSGGLIAYSQNTYENMTIRTTGQSIDYFSIASENIPENDKIKALFIENLDSGSLRNYLKFISLCPFISKVIFSVDSSKSGKLENEFIKRLFSEFPARNWSVKMVLANSSAGTNYVSSRLAVREIYKNSSSLIGKLRNGSITELGLPPLSVEDNIKLIDQIFYPEFSIGCKIQALTGDILSLLRAAKKLNDANYESITVVLSTYQAKDYRRLKNKKLTTIDIILQKIISSSDIIYTKNLYF